MPWALFARQGYVEEAWRIVDPMLKVSAEGFAVLRRWVNNAGTIAARTAASVCVRVNSHDSGHAPATVVNFLNLLDTEKRGVR
jgi:hypothetical protein